MIMSTQMSSIRSNNMQTTGSPVSVMGSEGGEYNYHGCISEMGGKENAPTIVEAGPRNHTSVIFFTELFSQTDEEVCNGILYPGEKVGDVLNPGLWLLVLCVAGVGDDKMCYMPQCS